MSASTPRVYDADAMVDAAAPARDETHRWLVQLRWLTFVAYGLAVATAAWMGEGRTTLAWPVGLLGTLAASNVALYTLRRATDGRRLFGPVLLADAVALTVLLHMTGGPMNPFTALYFVHITLAAILLDTRWVGLVFLGALVGFGLLFVLDAGRPHAHATDVSAHLRGMWIAFGVSAGLIAYFVARLTAALARRERELASARDRAARSRRVAAAVSLAAGAAHELGTPIGSIALAAEALDEALGHADGAARDDVALIRREVKRCRAILDGLSVRAGEAPGEGVAPTTLTALCDGASARLTPDEKARVIVDAGDGHATVPRTAIAVATASLLRNALEAGDGAVRLTARRRGDDLELRIDDDGAGMSPDVLERAGEPFFTTKPPGMGMGLGLFLVRALAEQLGGELRIDSTVGQGTTVVLRVPGGGADR